MDKNRANATIAAAEVLLTNTMGILSSTKYSLTKLNRALTALGALDWGPSVIQALGNDRITRFFTRLKPSRVSREDYRFLLKTMMITTPGKSAIFPFDLEEWRRLLVRYDLHIGLDFPERLTIIRELSIHLIDNPIQLARFSYSDALTFSLLFERDDCILHLWQAACVANNTSNRPLHRIPYETNSNALAQSIRADSIEETGLAKSHKRANLAISLPEEYDHTGPAGRIRILADSGAPTESVRRFLATGSAVNILRQAETALPSIASGIQCWAAYCDLMGCPYYPPTTERVCAWATIFNPGGSFGQYLAHLIKGCQILGVATDWNTPAVSAISRGLRKAQDVSFKFHNYLFRPCLMRFVEHEPIGAEFGLLGALAFLFLLRVQSEGIPTRRASLSEPLLSRTPQEYPALIGLRNTGSDTRLALKLSTRKNARQGVILMRPCFCRGGILVPASLCPVHAIWPAIIARVEINGLLLPSLQGPNLNRILKKTLERIGFHDARRFATYAFRRGCLVEMIRAQSTVSEIMRTAGWSSGQFKTYLDLREDEEAAILSLMRNLDTENESDDDIE